MLLTNGKDKVHISIRIELEQVQQCALVCGTGKGVFKQAKALYFLISHVAMLTHVLH